MEISRNFKTNNINIENNQKTQILSSGLRSDTIELNSRQKGAVNDRGLYPKIQSFGKSIGRCFDKNGNTHYFSVYKGFEEHFFKKGEGIVHDIKLTSKQKKLLTKRISEFENYKNSLSKTEQAKLEKNKHSLLDFAVVDGMPDTNLTAYIKFLGKYDKFKSGDFSNITNEDLAQLLYYTNTTDMVSDKKIGTFAQGRVGDCWFLSMLGNYASTVEGEKNIADRINGPDKDGNYSVIFDNPIDKSKKEEYTVKAKELENYDLSDIDSALSAGDLDVRIMEIAMAKMLQKYFLQQEVKINNPDFEEMLDYIKGSDEYIFQNFDILNEAEPNYTILAEGFIEKQLLVQRALGYDDNIKVYTTPDSRYIEKFSQRMDISKSDSIYEIEAEISGEDSNLSFSYNIKPTEYKNLSEILYNKNISSSELICSTSSKSPEDKAEARYISTGHAFNVMSKSVKDGTVVVNDPYNSAFPHIIDKEMFDKRMSAVTYIPRN